jgi:hypothetical protein
MPPAFAPRLRLVVALSLLMSAGILGCRSSSEDSGTDPIDPATVATGGRKATGGSSGAKGGSSGMAATGGGSGQASGSGGSPAVPPPSPGADGAAAIDVPAPADAPVSTVADATTTDVEAPASDSGAPATPGAGPKGPDGLAICHADPMALSICKQVENACENCPPGGAPPKNKLAQVCFDLIAKAKAGKASDADCAKFAVDNKCTVDKGGNVCGTLNCTVPGCPKGPCDKAQQYGDAAACKPLLAKCGPCK